MRKSILLPIALFLFGINVSAALSSSSLLYHERLFYTAKVWGYVKYFHTEIADNKVDWDAKLIHTLQNLSPAASEIEFNDLLLGMVRSAGQMSTASIPMPEVPDSLRYNLQLDWLNDPFLSSSIQAALDTINTNFRPRGHFLVGEAWAGGNPTFENDDYAYFWGQHSYPDQEHRLLALFRYWNIINYFFPYKYMMDQDWDSTLAVFIPKMINADNAVSFHLTFLELAAKINDSHAYTYSKTINNDIVGLYYLPLKLQFVENETVVTETSGTTQIKAGDIIKAVDDEDIYTFRDSLKKYIKGSNESVIERNLNYRIIKGMFGPVKLTIDTPEGEKDLTLSRVYSASEYTSLFSKTKPIWEIITADSANFGYVDMGRLEVSHIDNMFSELWETDGIIFDIRNYPNGTMWYMIRYLFNSPIHIANFTVPDIRYPGTLFWHYEYVGQGDFSQTYNNPIYILFDESTQSQAEYTVMAFEQHPKAVKIGSQTAAADGNVSKIYLPGGIYTYFTGLGTFYPDYTETQRIGIVPDIEAYPTIAGIRDGRDELLEIIVGEDATDLRDKNSAITVNKNCLFPNYPNPFNPITTISYQLSAVSRVELSIYNILGQKTTSLVNKKQPAGSYRVEWNAAGFASGIYFAVLKAGNFRQVRRMLLVR